MRISLLGDLAPCWLFAKDYSARPSLPSKQPAGGSNPSGRTDRPFDIRKIPQLFGLSVGGGSRGSRPCPARKAHAGEATS
jgi:hypothetical protein